MTQTSPTSPTRVAHRWRGNRWPAALDTQYFLMDERTTADLLSYALAVARLVTYFDAENRPQLPGSPGWETFFADDESFLLAQIAAAGEEPPAPRPGTGTGSDWERGRFLLGQICDWIHAAERLIGIRSDRIIAEALHSTLVAAVQNELNGVLPGRILRAAAGRDTRFADLLGEPSDRYPSEVAVGTLVRVTGQLGRAARSYLERSLIAVDNHPAHTGLFLSFIFLLRKSQAQLNELTERHLAFYYGEVLRMHPAPACPDKTWLSLSLAPDLPRFDLPAGTAFLATAPPGGQPPAFTTDREVTLTQARIADLRAVRIETAASGAVTAISTYPVPGSADGYGAPLPRPGAGWPMFGPSGPASGGGTTADPGGCALCFASSALALSGGSRRIKLSLKFRWSGRTSLARALDDYRKAVAADYEGTLTDAAFQTLLDHTFLIRLSTATGWVAVTGFTADFGAAAADTATFEMTADRTFPAIAAAPGAVLDLPMLSLALNPEARVFGYAAFGALALDSATLETAASGLDARLLGQTKPLALPPLSPFGPVPAVGDRLVLSHPDLDGKRLAEIGLSVTWLGLPTAPEDLASHYATYGQATRNDSFRTEFAILTPAGWQPLWPEGTPESARTSGVPLFTGPDGTGPLQTDQGWTFDLGDTTTLVAPSLRMVFAAPAYGFGQNAYRDVLASTILNNAKAETTLKEKFTLTAPKPLPLPPAPLQVKMSSASLRFRAVTDSRAGDLQVYALQPFAPPRPCSNPTLAPLDFPGESALYVGLANATPGTVIDLLFDLVDGPTAFRTPALSDPLAQVGWSYLSARGWKALPKQCLAIDETDHLSKTGAVSILLPDDLVADSDPESSGLCWLALTARAGVEPMSQIVGLYTNAVAVTRDAPSAAEWVALPPGMIAKPARPLTQVVKAVQSIATVGGAGPESLRDFRIRTSQRLRHKDRAVTRADYEDLVLTGFTDIQEAKCLRDADGTLVVVVTPVASRLGGQWPSVTTGRRQEISQFLKERSASWTSEIAVVNPAYETVTMRAWVAPTEPTPAGDFVHGLETRFARLLAPWQFDPDLPMHIGSGRVDAGTVASALSSCSGVAVVTGLSLTQIFATGPAAGPRRRHGLKDTALGPQGQGIAQTMLRASSPISVLVPAAVHDIRILPPERSIGSLAVTRDLYAASEAQQALWTRNPALIPVRPQPFGLGAMRVGHSLIVTSPEDARPVAEHPIPDNPTRPPVAMAALDP